MASALEQRLASERVAIARQSGAWGPRGCQAPLLLLAHRLCYDAHRPSGRGGETGERQFFTAI